MPLHDFSSRVLRNIITDSLTVFDWCLIVRLFIIFIAFCLCVRPSDIIKRSGSIEYFLNMDLGTQFMDRVILLLSKKKFYASAIAGAYLSAVILSHKEVSRIFDWLRKTLTFKVYDGFMLMFYLLVLAVFSLAVIFKIIKGKDKVHKTLWFSFNLALAVISYKVLVVFSVETIHFVQYALLALPVYAVAGRLGDTVFWVTLCGTVDEAFQYFVLYRQSNEVYFDFNDVILNLIGAGLGAVLILVFSRDRPAGGVAEGRSFQKWAFSPVVLCMMMIGLGGTILYLAGFLQLFPTADASTASIVLSRKAIPAHFWLHPKVGKSFHILHPIEGMVISAGLIFIYSLMDYRGSGR
jgi:hypothetical protein